MTLREGFEECLNRLDEAYYVLKKIHSDANFLNKDHPDYIKFRNEFIEAEKLIFNYKAVWYEVENG